MAAVSADDPPFDPAVWIKRKQKFPPRDGHFEVHAALAEVLKLPLTHSSLIPGPNLPISDFLELSFPKSSSALVFTALESWFSVDAPNTSVDCLLSRPIPSLKFLHDLERAVGQAWLDGCTSVVDWRYNDGREKFPLCAVTLWKELGRVGKDQIMWSKSRDWTDRALQNCVADGELSCKSSNRKAAAQGYTHTYFDTVGADLAKLAVYPSDADINQASEEAAAECESIIALLGITPGQLYESEPVRLPAIAQWFREEDAEVEAPLEDFDDVPPPTCEAEELQVLINAEERLDAPIRSLKTDQDLIGLACANIALAADEHMRIQEFAQVDEQLEDEIVGSEYATLQDTFASVAAALPAVQLSSEPSTRLTSFDTLDFKVLVRQRKEHQTRQAARSARVKNSRPDDEPSAAPPESMRCQILRKYHELLKEDQSKAAGTAVERQARWTTDPIPAAGNAANAAATAAAVATKAAIRPRKLFQDAKLPPSLLKEVESAGLTNFNPVRIDSYGIIWTEIGLRVGRVDALYSKGGGKNGKHGNVTEHHNISALSYLIVQVFELTHARTFRAHPQATSLFRTLQFRQLLPFTFLCRLSDAPIITPTGIELSLADATLFKELNSAIQHFDTAVKLSRSRKKAKELAEEEEVDTTVGF